MKPMEMVEHTRLVEQVMHDQRSLVHHLFQAGPVPGVARLNLTMAQLRALFVVAHSGSVPVGRLGASLGIGRPAATLLVNGLVRLNLVERREDPADRRFTLVRPSARGQELMDELRQGRRDQLSAWVGRLNEGDLAALARGLRALVTVASAVSQARSA